MYDIFAKLLEEKNLKAADVSRETGISSTVFSEWKKGKSKPNTEKLLKIAKTLNVSVEFLSGESTIVRCPECGLEYNKEDSDDIKYHKIEHSNWEKAVKKFGNLYCNTAENEKIKAENRTKRNDHTLSIEQRCEAQLEVFRCLFSRSVEANNYNLNHVTFEKYIAMMLNSSKYRANLEPELYNELVKRYGIRPGILDGESIYHIPAAHTVAAHKNGGNFTTDELEKIEEYKKLLIAARPKE